MNFKVNRSMPLIALSFLLCFATLTDGQVSTLPPLDSRELSAVLQEIQAMVKTHEEFADTFVMHEATPARIDQLYQMPEFIQQPKVTRENGLIFAGQGSLLSFDKPSDISAKISSWFPKEFAAAKAANEDRFFGHLDLYGPYLNWKDEPAAFMVLWECMPQHAWLNPTQNPYERSPRYGNFLAIADWSSGQYDFNLCVHERSGFRPAFSLDKAKVFKKEALEIGNRVTPVLQRKFARFLSSSRCSGTGPDDCVLILSMWSSLSPADTELARMIQILETDVSVSAPLPPPNLNEAYPERKPGFENILRKAAFLRIKQISILNASNAWSQQALQITVQQMSSMLQHYKGIGFSVNKTPQAQAATLAELESLYKNSSCSVIESWLEGQPYLRNTFALHHLQDPQPNCFISPGWEWAWLKKGESEVARDLRNRYLGLLGHQESGAVHEMLLGNLTDYGKDCFDNEGASLESWQKEVCQTWISEPQAVSFQLKHSRLTLDKAKQFQAVTLQLPPQISPTIDTWLSKLVKDMNVSEQKKMQTLIAEINRRKGSISSATWWKHPQHDKSVVELHLNINTEQEDMRWPYDGWRLLPYEGQRILLVLKPDSFSIVGMPSRILGEHDHREVVRISDLDDDGNLEVWLAESFRSCRGDDTDLQRELDCTAKSAEMGEIWGNTLSYFANTLKTHRKAYVTKAKVASRNAVLMRYAAPENEQDYVDKQACNIRLVSTVLKNKIAIDFGEGGRIGERGDLISMVCEPHPLHPEQTIVALFHDSHETSTEPTEQKKGFALAVLDVKQNKVISLYRDIIEEDATIRIDGSGLAIDTARYNLAPGVRAFGVLMSIGYSPRCAEGGENNYLTLFVEEDARLKPVLKNFAMSSWGIIEGSNGCGYTEESYTTDSVGLTLHMANTSTNGWRDIEVVAHHQVEQMSASGDSVAPNKKSHIKRLGKLRKNGEVYSGTFR